MKSAICSGMEILFNVQSTFPSKNKIVPDLSEHDCTLKGCVSQFRDFTRKTEQVQHPFGIWSSKWNCHTAHVKQYRKKI
jgi:hypothetical protein